MKIQCGCGAKYAFDVTPEMVRSPIQLVCQNCGQDISTMVNEVIRQQFPPALAAAAPQAAAPPPVAPPVEIAPPPPRLRVSVSAPAPAPASVPAPVSVAVASAAAPPAAPGVVPIPPPRTAVPVVRVAQSSSAAAAPAVAAPQVCSRHSPNLTTHTCLVCQKPICPKCMEIFGYVCSAYCKGQAEHQGIHVPVYAGQRDLAQKRQWRKAYAMITAVALTVLAVCGVWFWYAWVGSLPKVAYAARLGDAAFAGQLAYVSSEHLVFLHAGTLARHDPKAKKAVWSTPLLDKRRIADDAKATFEKNKANYQAAIANGEDLRGDGPPDLEEVTRNAEIEAAGELRLYQHGENVWVAFPDKLARFEWQSGKLAQEISIGSRRATQVAQGENLWVLAEGEGGIRNLMKINLSSGEATTNQFGGTALAFARQSTQPAGPSGSAAPGSSAPGAVPAGQKAGKPMDPKAVAASYQKLATPQRLAVPAVLAANANQERLTAEMQDAPPNTPAVAPAREPGAPDPMMLTKAGPLLVTTRLLDARTVTRKVMKDPPKTSALDRGGNLSANTAAANEILNEMQRDRAGDTETWDLGRYQVTLSRPASKGLADWQGDINGLPAVYPLETVDVIGGGKSVVVVDRNNRKLWEAKLTHLIRPIAAGRFGFSSSEHPNGEGPCVEQGDTLYVFDEAVVTSFDLATGTVKWRLPSVGTSGLFFDEQGTLYVNTTTATPENAQFSRQIDVSDKLRMLVLKVDPKTGKTIWRAVDEGLVSYVSGKFLYTMEAHAGQGSANELFSELTTMFEIPPHIRVRRLDTGSGRVLWQHYQKRAPLDVHFDRNSFQVLFKHEAQTIRFLSL